MIVLAPMQGLTELLFRKVYHHTFPQAIDYAVSPFLSLTHGNLQDSWKKIGDVWPENNIDSIPVIPQILGKEPEEFIALANRLHEVGYEEVNWNIGCPMRRVAHKHRGSGILPYPQEVDAILNQIIPKLNVSLSVKMRLGYNSKDEIFALIPILNQYPLKNVTIHPRIGKQLYGGTIDYETLAQVVPLLHHEVIYNGDINQLEDYIKVKQLFLGFNHVMIGRGVLRNPALPQQIKDYESNTTPRDYETQTKQMMLSLLEAIENRPISSEAKVRKTKEYWCLMADAFVSEIDKKRILHTPDFEATRNAIRDIIQ